MPVTALCVIAKTRNKCTLEAEWLSYNILIENIMQDLNQLRTPGIKRFQKCTD